MVVLLLEMGNNFIFSHKELKFNIGRHNQKFFSGGKLNKRMHSLFSFYTDHVQFYQSRMIQHLSAFLNLTYVRM